MRKRNYSLLADFSCLIAGALLPLAFAPYGYWWLAIFCLAILFHCWLKTVSILGAMRQGLLFGLGFFGIGVSWVYVAMHHFGGLGSALAIMITLLFIFTLSITLMVQAALISIFFANNTYVKRVMVLPASWVIFEWLRSSLLTGFPWLCLGFSQTHSPLLGYAPIIGTYGLSFLLALSVALLLDMLINNTHRCYLNSMAIVLIWLLGSLLQSIHWTKKVGQAETISLIQGNIAQSIKWQPQQVIPTLKIYHALTIKHWHHLIIWPEAAVPIFLDQAKPFLTPLNEAAIKHHSAIIMGIPIRQSGQFFNAIKVIGNGHGVYSKRHLVPFGEYSPLFFHKIMTLLAIPMSNFTAGAIDQKPLTIDGITVSPFICYEIAYAKLLHQALPQGQLLINLSDDSWFGHSFAAWQQLQIAQMRALQSGRYLLAVANNGITAIINPQGHIIKALPRFTRGVLTGQIYAMSGATPWIIIGNATIISIMVLIIVIAFWLKYRIRNVT